MLDLSREALEARMGERTGHYMPASLLDSQLRTLEPPLIEITGSVCRWRVELLASGETW